LTTTVILIASVFMPRHCDWSILSEHGNSQNVLAVSSGVLKLMCIISNYVSSRAIEI
jgi:hypothetical protein